MRILIADDDSDQLAIRCLLLEQAGFETVAAGSYEEALRAAGQLSPESSATVCALIDLNLPDEASGRRLIRELKRSHPALQVLVLTGSSRARLARMPERELIYDVLEKGQPASQLIEKLRKISTPY